MNCHKIFIRHLSTVLVLVAVLISTGLCAQDVALNPAEIRIGGYWHDVRESGETFLHISHEGAQVVGTFFRNTNACAQIGDRYFWGTLEGQRFHGTIEVCNPEYCVDLGLMEPERGAKLEFTVSDDCQKLSGSWQKHAYQFCGLTVGEEMEQLEFVPEKYPDCHKVQSEKEFQEAVREIYRGWQQKFESEEWTVQETYRSISAYEEVFSYQVVDKSGQPVSLPGYDVIDDFSDFQDLAITLAQTTGTEGASDADKGGGIQIEDPIQGGTSCECEVFCDLCGDAGVYAACIAHEEVHCRYAKRVCQEVTELMTKGSDDAAIRHQNSYGANLGALVEQEVVSYDASIGVYERILNSGECL